MAYDIYNNLLFLCVIYMDQLRNATPLIKKIIDFIGNNNRQSRNATSLNVSKRILYSIGKFTTFFLDPSSSGRKLLVSLYY